MDFKCMMGRKVELRNEGKIEQEMRFTHTSEQCK